MFKKHNPDEEYHIKRFNDFDEARIFIEDMNRDKELTIAAIDYMISHKEYYFLLKNLYRHIKEKNLRREIFEYALLSLDICPKREEDIKIIMEILQMKNSFSEDMVEFLKGCSCQLKDFILGLLENKDPYIRKNAVSILMHCPDEKTKNKIKLLIKKEESSEVKDEMRKFLDIVND
ncbi:hypothetical protein SAMN06265182_0325 [Persephonella hydrogeniphila]|uniref:HEAT repeat-containing protein n=1 Tax=Persephonella hydrogeniphila TaxID=198703 RepID=A0A285N176_9AQUI|nr:hypothetical protein [Persephonella hydrogeniphila]SNZ03224.1 hypothetical protein SAMN06265182_0325 [Persephonella hydrogeniphila]